MKWKCTQQIVCPCCICQIQVCSLTILLARTHSCTHTHTESPWANTRENNNKLYSPEIANFVKYQNNNNNYLTLIFFLFNSLTLFFVVQTVKIFLSSLVRLPFPFLNRNSLHLHFHLNIHRRSYFYVYK